MVYQIRNAQDEDLSRIEEIYAGAREFMARTGNPHQWGKKTPAHDQLVEDIREKRMFVLEDCGVIHGVFYFWIGKDPTYSVIEHGSWRSSMPYGTIHRIAGDGSGGVLKTAVEFAEKQIDHIRIDTHRDNTIMQRAVTKLGFEQRGIIFIADGTERIAYDWIK